MIFFHDLPFWSCLVFPPSLNSHSPPSPLPRRCSEALGWHLRPSCRGRRGLCYPAPGAFKKGEDGGTCWPKSNGKRWKIWEIYGKSIFLYSYCHKNYLHPLVILNMIIELVDLPIEDGGSFHSYVNFYQRVWTIWRIEARNHGDFRDL